MHRYAAFGTQLNSAIELPELSRVSVPGRQSWTLRVDEASSAALGGELLGTESVYGSIQVRLLARGSVRTLTFDDTGTFEIRPDCRVITWYPGSRRDGDAVRADVLGRVMAVAAHSEGALVLHASAVSIDGGAVAFLGPKHSGKSTIAMALVRGGARLLTDDTLVLRFGDGGDVWACPGVQRVRLWEDSSRALGAAARGGPGSKPMMDAHPSHQVERSDVRLLACHVIAPSIDSADPPVSRASLSPTQAALACVSFAKLGALLGGEEGGVVLDRAVRVARSTPFYVISIQRDLHRLGRVADEVLGWRHADAAARTG